jgi:uncharacterized cupin superfamily protein
MQIEVRKPTEEEMKMAESWPIWKKEISEFPWEYGEKETCLILKGRAEVETEDGEKAEFGAGDWVAFPSGMRCTWRIKEDLEKHYKIGRAHV